MINHISVGVNEPERAARVLAEIWNGYAYPFPPSPGGFIVFADDSRGTAIEFTPKEIELLPGNGFPSYENFSLETPTGEFEATFQHGTAKSRFSSVHIAVNSPLSVEEIKAIGDREGWRTLTCNRESGLFQLIEMWFENQLMIEVFTPEMTKRYVEIATPQGWAGFLDVPFVAKTPRETNLNLVA